MIARFVSGGSCVLTALWTAWGYNVDVSWLVFVPCVTAVAAFIVLVASRSASTGATALGVSGVVIVVVTFVMATTIGWYLLPAVVCQTVAAILAVRHVPQVTVEPRRALI